MVEWKGSGHEDLAGKRLAERDPGPLDIDDEVSAIFRNDGNRTAGNEAQAFQKAPGFILAMNFVDLADIADVEHGEWHGVYMNQVRKKVSFNKLTSQ